MPRLVQQPLELRPDALDPLQVVGRARRAAPASAAGLTPTGAASSPAAARAASPAARAASRTRSLIAAARRGRRRVLGTGVASGDRRPAPAARPPERASGCVAGAGAAAGGVPACAAGGRRRRGLAARAGIRYGSTMKTDGAEDQSRRARRGRAAPPTMKPTTIAATSAIAQMISGPDQVRAVRGLRQPCAFPPGAVIRLRPAPSSRARAASRPPRRARRACSTQPSRVTRPWKPSRLPSTQATSSGVQAAIWRKWKKPSRCSSASSAGPTPLISFRSSGPRPARRREAPRAVLGHRRPAVARLAGVDPRPLLRAGQRRPRRRLVAGDPRSPCRRAARPASPRRSPRSPAPPRSATSARRSARRRSARSAAPAAAPRRARSASRIAANLSAVRSS